MSPRRHTAASSPPASPGSLPLILSWFTQIAANFPSPFLHIGADETFDLGAGRTKSDVDQRGLGPVYADFLRSIHTTLAPLNRRLIFWGDIGDSDPSAIPGIPKDMIAVPWVYWHKDSYDNDILPFKNQGSRNLGCARRRQLERGLPRRKNRARQHLRIRSCRPASRQHRHPANRVE